MADGRIIIDAKIDTAQAVKSVATLKKEAATIAATFEKQGMSAADAMKKAWQQITDGAISGASKTKTAITGMKAAFTSLGSTVAGLGGLLVRILGPITFISLVKECIELGSNVQEVQNVVDTAFGSMAYKMETFADTAITGFGMSELAAKKTGSTLMAMAKGMGIAEGAASDMAIALTGLTGDVASFYNISQDEAATKLKSVFTGETESLKDLGVVMTQTNLEQYALSKGISKSISAMTQAELATLRYHFVLDSLSMASGDFVRTQDSWANQTRILTMQIQALGASIGSILTTVLTPAIKTLNGIVANLVSVASVISSAISAIFGVQISQNSAVATSAADAAAAENDLASGIGNAAKAAKKSLAGFDELNVLQSNSGSGGAGGGGGSITNETTVEPVEGYDTSHLEDASEIIGGIADKIKELILPLQEIDFAPAISAFDQLAEAAAGLGSTIGDSLEWVWYNILVPLATWTIEEALPASLDLLSAALELLDSVIVALQPAAQWLWDNFLQPLASWSGDAIVSLLTELTDLFRDLSDVLSGDMSFGEFVANLTPVQTVLVAIVTALGAIGAASAGMTVFNTITGFFSSIIGMNATGIMGKLAQVFQLTASGAYTLSGAMSAVFGPGSVIAGIGALVGGAVLAISNFFSMLQGGFNWVNEALMLLGIAITAVGAIILGAPAALTGVIAAIVAAMATAVVLIKENWAEISTWFNENIIQPVCQFFTELWTNISSWASECWSAIQSTFQAVATWFDKNVIQPVVSFFSGLWTTVSEFFANLWNDIVTIYTGVAEWFDNNVIQPVVEFFTGLWEDISTAASDCWNAIIEFFTPAFEWFSELFDSILQTISDVFYNIGVIASGCWDIIKAVWEIVSEWFDTNIIQPLGEFFTDLWDSISSLASDAWEGIQTIWTTVSTWFDENIIQPVSDFFSEMWTSIKTWAFNAWNGIKSVFSTIGSWINTKIIQPVSKFFSGLWNGFLDAAKSAWAGVKSVFGSVASFFKETFKKAWSGIVAVFSVAGEIFKNIKDGILSAFKVIVNGIIRGLNSAIAIPFNGINTALKKIRDINILGLTPFSALRTISVPQIPYLAQGAVLPANKPFLAMVGDQKNGTNVEAPLETIKQALAEVMASQGTGDVNITFTGDLAQLARVLKPVIDKENRRVGSSLIQGVT